MFQQVVRVALIGAAIAVSACASGGQVFKAGGDATQPELVQHVRPDQTPSAIAARVEGDVVLECDVQPDGSVANIRVVRSLDRVHGLDAEAIKAVSMWQFKPGVRNGRPVTVRVPVNIAFRLQ